MTWFYFRLVSGEIRVSVLVLDLFLVGCQSWYHIWIGSVTEFGFSVATVIFFCIDLGFATGSGFGLGFGLGIRTGSGFVMISVLVLGHCQVLILEQNHVLD